MVDTALYVGSSQTGEPVTPQLSTWGRKQAQLRAMICGARNTRRWTKSETKQISASYSCLNFICPANMDDRTFKEIFQRVVRHHFEFFSH